MSEKLFKNTATVGGMTLVSRVLGLVRDMVFARFGVGPGMDAFFVAFKIPNFMRRLFAEGAFSQAFVPVLAEYKKTGSHEQVRSLLDRVAGTLLGVLGGLTLLGVLGSPVLVTLFAPGFLDNPSKFDLTAELLGITFPYLMLISLVAMAAGVLNTYGRFAVPAFAPVWLNVILIGAALLVAPRLEEPMLALAWGVLLSGVVQLLFLLPSLARLRLMPRPRWGWRDSGVRKILRLMGPGILGSSVAQINLLFDTLIASFLVTGSVSWLYYSDRLVEFPLGIFGIALATVILPSLSRHHAAADPDQFARTLDSGLRWVLLIGLPAAAGLALLAAPTLATLFLYGDFTPEDVRMASLSLIAYSLGLPGFMLVKVLAPAFYARQDVRTPVKVAITALLSNMVLNVLFVVPLVLLAFAGPHAGLALATSIAAYVNAGLLYRHLRRQDAYHPLAGWGAWMARIGVATLVLGLVVGLGAPALEQWAQWPALERAWHLLLWVLAGVASYLLVLRLLGMRLRHLWAPTRMQS
jgi:putative peptidoglycan lipid II flippase